MKAVISNQIDGTILDLSESIDIICEILISKLKYCDLASKNKSLNQNCWWYF